MPHQLFTLSFMCLIITQSLFTMEPKEHKKITSRKLSVPVLTHSTKASPYSFLRLSSSDPTKIKSFADQHNKQQDTITSQRPLNELIDAIKKNDVERIKNSINNPNINPNDRDQWGNAGIHVAALKYNEALEIKKDIEIKKEIIFLLFRDPRTNTMLLSAAKNTAHAILGSVTCPILRRVLFARTSLDRIVHEETFAALMDTKHIKIEVILENIINRIATIESEQKTDRELPEEALLPDYANKEFITAMINYRLAHEKAHVEHLFINTNNNNNNSSK